MAAIEPAATASEPAGQHAATASAQTPAELGAPVAAGTQELVTAEITPLDLTLTPNDIWDRIRRGFAMPELISSEVDYWQARYLKNPRALNQIFQRGGQYLYFIVSELEARNLPTELALLPMVESSYNPFAVSSSRAAGLWQFIPSTGKVFKLEQSAWVDERRDVVASTRAALDYFEYIYDMHGDWHLAVASYNAGEGAVQRAVRRQAARNGPTGFQDLDLPQQTREYLPKLQALKNIVSFPELFDLELPYIDNDAFFVPVPAPSGLDLATAADLAELPYDEFLALNAHFNRPVTTEDNRVLLLPRERAQQFQLGVSRLGNNAAHWSIHTVKPGETLAYIARKYKMRTEDLMTLNGLNRRSALRPGSRLLVARGGGVERAVGIHLQIPEAARHGAR